MSTVTALTGGSGDVNPQPLKLRCELLSVNAVDTWNFSSSQLALPVQRLANGQRAQVMEIIKIEGEIVTACADSALTNHGVSVALSSRSYGANPVVYRKADPYCLYFQMGVPVPLQNGKATEKSSFDMNGGAKFGTYWSFEKDLTDNAGHGVLYGQDNIFAQIGVVSTEAKQLNAELNVVIWYRWKNVGFQEYIGMVVTQ